jgi:hypothetical protein
MAGLLSVSDWEYVGYRALGLVVPNASYCRPKPVLGATSHSAEFRTRN